MIQHGVAPYLECSSRGDKRFSAFYATVDGKSIEATYQAAKRFSDGTTGLSPTDAKGRRAVNMPECAALYRRLWETYILEHPELLTILKTASGLSDTFGRPNCQCQATELWRIRCIALQDDIDFLASPEPRS